MMKNSIILLILCSILFTSCNDKAPSKDNTPISGEDLIERAWKDFREGRYASAEGNFNQVLQNEDPSIYLVGYYGLGWTFLKTGKYLNAKNEFNKFFTMDEYDVYRPSGSGTSAAEDSIFRNVRAGQLITLNALGEHENAITISTIFNVNTGQIMPNWKFNQDQNITIRDMRVLKAISHFAVGGNNNLAISLSLVRMIDPNFNADINTTEGILLLMRKLEEIMDNG